MTTTYSIGQQVEAQRYSNGYTHWHRGTITAVNHKDPMHARGLLCSVLFHDHQTPLPRCLDEIRS